MAKFLITGARSPVALELSRNLSKDGHTVYLADSLRFPLAKHSKSVTKTFYITAPRESLSQFENDLKNLLVQYEVDVLIPTCEEVFYISAIMPSLSIHAQIFCPKFKLMQTLHSKYEVYSVAQDTGFSNPNTELLTGKELLARKMYKEKVIKKEFCRFGTGVLVEPNFEKVSTLVCERLNDRFIIQDKIEGVEYCTYAIVQNGKVLLESIYTPQHRIRRAAGIYFKPVVNEDISLAIRNFCSKNNITGQIGFDIIIKNKEIFLLECNPRATSGLHLLSENSLSNAFLENEHLPLPKCKLSRPKMIKTAMLVIGLPISIVNSQFKEFQSDYQAASDVITISNDRSFILYSLLALLEISIISLKTFSSLRAASTYDIEWDGEILDVR